MHAQEHTLTHTLSLTPLHLGVPAEQGLGNPVPSLSCWLKVTPQSYRRDCVQRDRPLPFYDYVDEEGKLQQREVGLLNQIKQDKLQDQGAEPQSQRQRKKKPVEP